MQNFHMLPFSVLRVVRWIYHLLFCHVVEFMRFTSAPVSALSRTVGHLVLEASTESLTFSKLTLIGNWIEVFLLISFLSMDHEGIQRVTMLIEIIWLIVCRVCRSSGSPWNVHQVGRLFHTHFHVVPLCSTVSTDAGWPRHRENREFDSYFFQTGKTQGILLSHRENCWDTGKIFWLYFVMWMLYFDVLLAVLVSNYGVCRWLPESYCSWDVYWWLLSGAWKNGASSPSILKAKWTLGLWPVGGGERVTSFSHLGAPPLHWGGPPLVAKGCPGCGPVPWGSFFSGYMVPQWVPLSLPPLKNNYLCGSPCQLFFKLGFQEMLKAIVWKSFSALC